MEENIVYAPRGDCTTNPEQQHPFLTKCGRIKSIRPKETLQIYISWIKVPYTKRNSCIRHIFPTAKSSCGHTCSQLSMGTVSDKCSV